MQASGSDCSSSTKCDVCTADCTVVMAIRGVQSALCSWQVLLVCFAGMMAGLTLGLLSLDKCASRAACACLALHLLQGRQGTHTCQPAWCTTCKPAPASMRARCFHNFAELSSCSSAARRAMRACLQGGPGGDQAQRQREAALAGDPGGAGEWLHAYSSAPGHHAGAAIPRDSLERLSVHQHAAAKGIRGCWLQGLTHSVA